MLYGVVPELDRPCSRLVMGTMSFHTGDMDRVRRLLDAFVALGGNCLDTAQIYGGGESEKAIGLWLKEQSPFPEMLILTKGAHHDSRGPRVNPEAIEADLLQSLDRLQVDTIDIYMLHRDDPSVPVDVIVECLNEQKRLGRIRVFGGSNWTTARLQAANEYARRRNLAGFAASSPNLSLAVPNEPRWPGCVAIVEPSDFAWYEEHQLPVFAWSAQASGFFTKRVTPQCDDEMMVRVYFSDLNWQRKHRAGLLAQQMGVSANDVALAYVLNQPFPTFALVGPANPEELASSAQAFQVSLTPQVRRWLETGEGSIPAH